MFLAAAANQGGSNLTLLVALLGILGTLAAALVTQWMTGRREERRWSRERELEATRWERERQERQEQWQREDKARLHADRLKWYADLDTWARALLAAATTCAPTSTNQNPNPTQDDLEAIFTALTDYEYAQKMADLLGSSDLRRVKGLVSFNGFHLIALAAGDFDPTTSEKWHLEEDVRAALAGEHALMAHNIRELRSLIRSDLGIEPPDAMEA